ncbi:MAG: hypothetical protein ACFFAN_11090 [Promethearchaeota archaeon]
MNFKRKGLLNLLDYCQQHRVNTVIIEYKDQLARFGVDFLKEILNSNGTELLIVNGVESNYIRRLLTI